ncbi:hypothetical protein [Thiosocius teredinicola]|uniref:hypothetical protein n=1 Tax=Thiosocius teredinicola TaxID=1973002 RepID=UPI0009910E16
MAMMTELEFRAKQLEPQAMAVHRALQKEIEKLCFTEPVPSIDGLDEAECSLEADPASGDKSLSYEWRDKHGHKVGGLVFHADGSFFAEYDVIRAHPAKPSLFVEAVSAWGRDDVIKAEARCLPMAS